MVRESCPLVGVDSLQSPSLISGHPNDCCPPSLPRKTVCSYLPVPRHKSGLSQVWWQKEHYYFGCCTRCSSCAIPLNLQNYLWGDVCSYRELNWEPGGAHQHPEPSSLNHDGDLVPLYNWVSILKDGSHGHAILLCTSTPLLHTKCV